MLNATPTPITPPRVPLIDPRTGLIDRSWYMFFLSLFRTAQDATDPQLIPDTNSLIASYDAALAALAQDVGMKPEYVAVAPADVITAQSDSQITEMQKQLDAILVTPIQPQVAEMQKQLDALAVTPTPELSGIYVPYRNASDDVDLNNKHLVNVSHLGVGRDSTPNILGRFIGDNGALSRVAMRGYSADANGSSIRVTKFRGTTTAPQVPQSGDSLGKFEFAGYATTSADGLAGAYWESVTTEMWGATAHGTKSLLYVTPNTTTTPVVAMTVDQDKKVTLPGALSVTGHTTFEGVTSTGATGTGKLVFDSAPTITGHPTIEGVTSTGATGTGKFVFDNSPALVTPALGTPASGNFSTGTFTWPTFNQDTTGKAAKLYTSPNAYSFTGINTVSGASVAVFSGTLPTGSGTSTNQWMEVIIDSTSFWIPIWAK